MKPSLELLGLWAKAYQLRESGYYLHVIPRRPHSDYRGPVKYQAQLMYQNPENLDVSHANELVDDKLFDKEEDAWTYGIGKIEE